MAISIPTISRIENVHEKHRWGTMQKLAAALGRFCVFADELLGAVHSRPSCCCIAYVVAGRSANIDELSLVLLEQWYTGMTRPSTD